MVVVSGCGGDVQERGARLTAELPASFPDQISAVSFEYNFLDPPVLYIDIEPPMEPEAERRFLCDEVMPRIEEAGGDIDATTSYGWYMSEECPSTDSSVTTVVTHAIRTTWELPGFGWLFPLLLAIAGGPLLLWRRRDPGLTPILIGVIAVAVGFLALNVLIGVSYWENELGQGRQLARCAG